MVWFSVWQHWVPPASCLLPPASCLLAPRSSLLSFPCRCSRSPLSVAVALRATITTTGQVQCSAVQCSAMQRCRRLPNFGRSPEFGSFQKIAQNFCAIFKIGLKRPKKTLNAPKMLKKAPKNSTEFLYFFQKPLKKTPAKAPNFF